MRLADYVQRLADLGGRRFTAGWPLAAGLDSLRREKVALYAEEIAATLGRAAAALATLESRPDDRSALLSATRELGRISGYVETIWPRSSIILTGASRLALNGGWNI